jgi:von Hippel-Lindau disease tumor supressor
MRVSLLAALLLTTTTVLGNLTIASPAQAESKHRAELAGAKSLNGDIPASLMFINKTEAPVKIYWLDYKGDRQFYQTLAPEEEYIQQSYLSHPWLVTDSNDKAWYVFYPDAQTRLVMILDPNRKIEPRPSQITTPAKKSK